MKTIRSRSVNHKQFKVIPSTVAFESDEVYDTQVNIYDDLQINTNIYNASLLKDIN